MATAQLVPNLDLYVANNLNILLSGKHGVGKTAVLKEIAAQNNLKVKYFSCSTLDPFTDLVGIPYPMNIEGVKTLEMVRPREIDEANVIFFDELNRAQDSKTLNAVLEIVQFRTINGEQLPNLMMCWAAVNPPDDDYQVQDLDPALVDRFDVFHDIKPTVSVPYLESRGIDKQIAMALQDWHTSRQTKDSKAAYISPRRIEKMAMLVQKTKKPAVVVQMLPPGEVYDHGALIKLLNTALSKPTAGGVGLGGDYDRAITYTKQGFMANPDYIVDTLTDPAVSPLTIQKIVEVLQRQNETMLAHGFAPIIEALPPASFEGLYNGWTPAKQNKFKREWAQSITSGTAQVPDIWLGSTANSVGNNLAGATFCVTGVFPSMTQDGVEKLITNNGGALASSITNSVDYLIVGTGAGSTKMNAAAQKGVRGMSFTQLTKAVNSGTWAYHTNPSDVKPDLI